MTDRLQAKAIETRKVYYNSLCPVCRAGIEGQRQRMTAAGENVEWCDINENPEALAEIGVGLEAVRRKLHVREIDGRLAVGAEAFVALWQRTPGQRWLARAIGRPGPRTLARLAYDSFAAALYRWNKFCGRW
jgi:predicted DCC family thiol-disulfide oxidoreductase YuxK